MLEIYKFFSAVVGLVYGFIWIEKYDEYLENKNTPGSEEFRELIKVYDLLLLPFPIALAMVLVFSIGLMSIGDYTCKNNINLNFFRKSLFKKKGDK